MNDKNNPKLAFLIAILILLQGISIIKMNGLQRQVDITNKQIQYINDKVSQEMSVVYTNVERILDQQASPIEGALTEIGSVNKEELTVPITFTLTLKEVSENTTVYLDLAGELFPMTKDGITFTSTITRDVFASALPKVVIEEEGIKKIRQDNQVGIGSIKEMLFPTMMPRLSGNGRFGGGTYNRKGKFSADIKESSSGIEFEKISLLVTVDGIVISHIDIPVEELGTGYEINEEVQLNSGQTCTMNVVATDSIGLEHHFIVDHWVAGSNLQREPWFGDEKIYTPTGELLWELDIQSLDGC